MWCVADSRRMAGRQADGRGLKLLGREASVRVWRVIIVIGGLWLLLGGVGLIVTGLGELGAE